MTPSFADSHGPLISALFLDAARHADLPMLGNVLALFPNHRLEKTDAVVFWNGLLKDARDKANRPSFRPSDFHTLERCCEATGSPFRLNDPTLQEALWHACSNSDWWCGHTLAASATVDFLMQHAETPAFLHQKYAETGYHPVVEAFKTHGAYSPHSLKFFKQSGGDFDGLYTHHMKGEQRQRLYAYSISNVEGLKDLKSYATDFSLPTECGPHTVSFEALALISLQTAKFGKTFSFSGAEKHIQSVQPVSFDAERVLASRDWKELRRFSPERWCEPFSDSSWNGLFGTPARRLWGRTLNSSPESERSEGGYGLSDVSGRLVDFLKYFSSLLNTRLPNGAPLWTALVLDLFEHREDVAKLYWGKIRQSSPSLGRHLSSSDGLIELIEAYHERYKPRSPEEQPMPVRGVRRSVPAIGVQGMSQLVCALRNPIDAWLHPNSQGKVAMDVLLAHPKSPFWLAPCESLEHRPSLFPRFSEAHKERLFSRFLNHVSLLDSKTERDAFYLFLEHCPFPSDHSFERTVSSFKPKELAKAESLYLLKRNGQPLGADRALLAL